MVRYLAIMFAAVMVILAGPAHATNSSFAYEGRLYDNGGNPLNSVNVNFRIEVYSDTGGCLLYQESHAQNLSSASTHEQGVFSLKIGTGARGGSDPGLAFLNVFKIPAPSLVMVVVTIRQRPPISAI